MEQTVLQFNTLEQRSMTTGQLMDKGATESVFSAFSERLLIYTLRQCKKYRQQMSTTALMHSSS